jgi:ATP-dependent Zn protease
MSRRDILESAADMLLAEEVITGDDLREINNRYPQPA